MDSMLELLDLELTYDSETDFECMDCTRLPNIKQNLDRGYDRRHGYRNRSIDQNWLYFMKDSMVKRRPFCFSRCWPIIWIPNETSVKNTNYKKINSKAMDRKPPQPVAQNLEQNLSHVTLNNDCLNISKSLDIGFLITALVKIKFCYMEIASTTDILESFKAFQKAPIFDFQCSYYSMCSMDNFDIRISTQIYKFFNLKNVDNWEWRFSLRKPTIRPKIIPKSTFTTDEKSILLETKNKKKVNWFSKKLFWPKRQVLHQTTSSTNEIGNDFKPKTKLNLWQKVKVCFKMFKRKGHHSSVPSESIPEEEEHIDSFPKNSMPSTQLELNSKEKEQNSIFDKEMQELGVFCNCGKRLSGGESSDSDDEDSCAASLNQKRFFRHQVHSYPSPKCDCSHTSHGTKPDLWQKAKVCFKMFKRKGHHSSIESESIPEEEEHIDSFHKKSISSTQLGLSGAESSDSDDEDSCAASLNQKRFSKHQVDPYPSPKCDCSKTSKPDLWQKVKVCFKMFKPKGHHSSIESESIPEEEEHIDSFPKKLISSTHLELNSKEKEQNSIFDKEMQELGVFCNCGRRLSGAESSDSDEDSWAGSLNQKRFSKHQVDPYPSPKCDCSKTSKPDLWQKVKVCFKMFKPKGHHSSIESESIPEEEEHIDSFPKKLISSTQLELNSKEEEHNSIFDKEMQELGVFCNCGRRLSGAESSDSDDEDSWAGSLNQKRFSKHQVDPYPSPKCDCSKTSKPDLWQKVKVCFKMFKPKGHHSSIESESIPEEEEHIDSFPKKSISSTQLELNSKEEEHNSIFDKEMQELGVFCNCGRRLSGAESSDSDDEDSWAGSLNQKRFSKHQVDPYPSPKCDCSKTSKPDLWQKVKVCFKMFKRKGHHSSIESESIPEEEEHIDSFPKKSISSTQLGLSGAESSDSDDEDSWAGSLNQKRFSKHQVDSYPSPKCDCSKTSKPDLWQKVKVCFKMFKPKGHHSSIESESIPEEEENIDSFPKKSMSSTHLELNSKEKEQNSIFELNDSEMQELGVFRNCGRRLSGGESSDSDNDEDSSAGALSQKDFSKHQVDSYPLPSIQYSTDKLDYNSQFVCSQIPVLASRAEVLSQRLFGGLQKSEPSMIPKCECSQTSYGTKLDLWQKVKVCFKMFKRERHCSSIESKSIPEEEENIDSFPKKSISSTQLELNSKEEEHNSIFDKEMQELGVFCNCGRRLSGGESSDSDNDEDSSAGALNQKDFSKPSVQYSTDKLEHNSQVIGSTDKLEHNNKFTCSQIPVLASRAEVLSQRLCEGLQKSEPSMTPKCDNSRTSYGANIACSTNSHTAPTFIFEPNFTISDTSSRSCNPFENVLNIRDKEKSFKHTLNNSDKTFENQKKDDLTTIKRLNPQTGIMNQERKSAPDEKICPGSFNNQQFNLSQFKRSSTMTREHFYPLKYVTKPTPRSPTSRIIGKNKVPETISKLKKNFSNASDKSDMEPSTSRYNSKDNKQMNRKILPKIDSNLKAKQNVSKTVKNTPDKELSPSPTKKQISNPIPNWKRSPSKFLRDTYWLRKSVTLPNKGEKDAEDCLDSQPSSSVAGASSSISHKQQNNARISVPTLAEKSLSPRKNDKRLACSDNERSLNHQSVALQMKRNKSIVDSKRIVSRVQNKEVMTDSRFLDKNLSTLSIEEARTSLKLADKNVQTSELDIIQYKMNKQSLILSNENKNNDLDAEKKITEDVHYQEQSINFVQDNHSDIIQCAKNKNTLVLPDENESGFDSKKKITEAAHYHGESRNIVQDNYLDTTQYEKKTKSLISPDENKNNGFHSKKKVIEAVHYQGDSRYIVQDKYLGIIQSEKNKQLLILPVKNENNAFDSDGEVTEGAHYHGESRYIVQDKHLDIIQSEKNKQLLILPDQNGKNGFDSKKKVIEALDYQEQSMNFDQDKHLDTIQYEKYENTLVLPDEYENNGCASKKKDIEAVYYHGESRYIVQDNYLDIIQCEKNKQLLILPNETENNGFDTEKKTTEGAHYERESRYIVQDKPLDIIHCVRSKQPLILPTENENNGFDTENRITGGSHYQGESRYIVQDKHLDIIQSEKNKQLLILSNENENYGFHSKKNITEGAHYQGDSRYIVQDNKRLDIPYKKNKQLLILPVKNENNGFDTEKKITESAHYQGETRNIVQDKYLDVIHCEKNKQLLILPNENENHGFHSKKNITEGAHYQGESRYIVQDKHLGIIQSEKNKQLLILPDENENNGFDTEKKISEAVHYQGESRYIVPDKHLGIIQSEKNKQLLILPVKNENNGFDSEEEITERVHYQGECRYSVQDKHLGIIQSEKNKQLLILPNENKNYGFHSKKNITEGAHYQGDSRYIVQDKHLGTIQCEKNKQLLILPVKNRNNGFDSEEEVTEAVHYQGEISYNVQDKHIDVIQCEKNKQLLILPNENRNNDFGTENKITERDHYQEESRYIVQDNKHLDIPYKKNKQLLIVPNENRNNDFGTENKITEGDHYQEESRYIVQDNKHLDIPYKKNKQLLIVPNENRNNGFDTEKKITEGAHYQGESRYIVPDKHLDVIHCEKNKQSLILPNENRNNGFDSRKNVTESVHYQGESRYIVQDKHLGIIQSEKNKKLLILPNENRNNGFDTEKKISEAVHYQGESRYIVQDKYLDVIHCEKNQQSMILPNENRNIGFDSKKKITEGAHYQGESRYIVPDKHLDIIHCEKNKQSLILPNENRNNGFDSRKNVTESVHYQEETRNFIRDNQSLILSVEKEKIKAGAKDKIENLLNNNGEVDKKNKFFDDEKACCKADCVKPCSRNMKCGLERDGLKMHRSYSWHIVSTKSSSNLIYMQRIQNWRKTFEMELDICPTCLKRRPASSNNNCQVKNKFSPYFFENDIRKSLGVVPRNPHFFKTPPNKKLEVLQFPHSRLENVDGDMMSDKFSEPTVTQVTQDTLVGCNHDKQNKEGCSPNSLTTIPTEKIYSVCQNYKNCTGKGSRVISKPSLPISKYQYRGKKWGFPLKANENIPCGKCLCDQNSDKMKNTNWRKKMGAQQKNFYPEKHYKHFKNFVVDLMVPSEKDLEESKQKNSYNKLEEKVFSAFQTQENQESNLPLLTKMRDNQKPFLELPEEMWRKNTQDLGNLPDRMKMWTIWDYNKKLRKEAASSSEKENKNLNTKASSQKLKECGTMMWWQEENLKTSNQANTQLLNDLKIEGQQDTIESLTTTANVHMNGICCLKAPQTGPPLLAEAFKNVEMLNKLQPHVGSCDDFPRQTANQKYIVGENLEAIGFENLVLTAFKPGSSDNVPKIKPPTSQLFSECLDHLNPFPELRLNKSGIKVLDAMISKAQNKTNFVDDPKGKMAIQDKSLRGNSHEDLETQPILDQKLKVLEANSLLDLKRTDTNERSWSDILDIDNLNYEEEKLSVALDVNRGCELINDSSKSQSSLTKSEKILLRKCKEEKIIVNNKITDGHSFLRELKGQAMITYPKIKINNKMNLNDDNMRILYRNPKMFSLDSQSSCLQALKKRNFKRNYKNLERQASTSCSPSSSRYQTIRKAFLNYFKKKSILKGKMPSRTPRANFREHHSFDSYDDSLPRPVSPKRFLKLQNQDSYDAYLNYEVSFKQGLFGLNSLANNNVGTRKLEQMLAFREKEKRRLMRKILKRKQKNGYSWFESSSSGQVVVNDLKAETKKDDSNHIKRRVKLKEENTSYHRGDFEKYQPFRKNCIDRGTSPQFRVEKVASASKSNGIVPSKPKNNLSCSQNLGPAKSNKTIQIPSNSILSQEIPDITTDPVLEKEKQYIHQLVQNEVSNTLSKFKNIYSYLEIMEQTFEDQENQKDQVPPKQDKTGSHKTSQGCQNALKYANLLQDKDFAKVSNIKKKSLGSSFANKPIQDPWKQENNGKNLNFRPLDYNRIKSNPSAEYKKEFASQESLGENKYSKIAFKLFDGIKNYMVKGDSKTSNIISNPIISSNVLENCLNDRKAGLNKNVVSSPIEKPSSLLQNFKAKLLKGFNNVTSSVSSDLSNAELIPSDCTIIPNPNNQNSDMNLAADCRSNEATEDCCLCSLIEIKSEPSLSITMDQNDSVGDLKRGKIDLNYMKAHVLWNLGLGQNDESINHFIEKQLNCFHTLGISNQSPNESNNFVPNPKLDKPKKLNEKIGKVKKSKAKKTMAKQNIGPLEKLKKKALTFFGHNTSYEDSCLANAVFLPGRDTFNVFHDERNADKIASLSYK